MGTIEWIITGLTVLLTTAGAACAIILPILLLAGIAFFIYRRSQQSNTYRQAAQSWPSTTGTILISTLQSRRSGRSHSTYPVVGYQYTVNGQTYTSQAIKAGDQFMNVRVSGQAQTTVARYPVGSTVTVYYNPANPSESALER